MDAIEPRWPLFPELGKSVQYILHRSRRRSVSVEVHAQGELVVRSPNRLPLNEIEDFLKSRKDWITRRLEEAQSAQKTIPVLPTEQHYHHRGDVLFWEGALPALQKWRRKEAQVVFQDVLLEVLPHIGSAASKYQSLHLRRMKRRWGSCSSTGKITLNEYLIRVPDESIRAVVAHELAHLVHMNHGGGFQKLVRSLHDQYDEANAELDRWTAILPEPQVQMKSGTLGPAEKRTIWLTD